MRVGSLFTGIGGIDLGLERAGCEIVWQVECDSYCQNVLERHWQHIPRWRDARALPAQDLPRCDLLAAGFPCQDLSDAHTRTPRRGLDGPRSGLWRVTARLIAAIKPSWVLLENIAAWRRWMPTVRADLARLGYASLPLVVSAGQVGADHPRPRGFVVAHTDGDGESLRAVDAEVARLCAVAGSVSWPDPPEPLGVADGIPHRMDRLAALGNAAVPQVVEVLGRAMLAADRLTSDGARA